MMIRRVFRVKMGLKYAVDRNLSPAKPFDRIRISILFWPGRKEAVETEPNSGFPPKKPSCKALHWVSGSDMKDSRRIFTQLTLDENCLTSIKKIDYIFSQWRIPAP